MIAETSGADWLAAIFTAVGGIAGAVATFFAWRSAKASRDTGRDAREALAIAVEPEVFVGYGNVAERNGFLISNGSKFDAVDVEVEVRRRDGDLVRSTRERLARSTEWDGYWIADDGTNEALVDPYETFEDVVVHYWDSQHVARYELRVNFNTERNDPNRLPSGRMEKRRVGWGDR